MIAPCTLVNGSKGLSIGQLKSYFRKQQLLICWQWRWWWSTASSVPVSQCRIKKKYILPEECSNCLHETTANYWHSQSFSALALFTTQHRSTLWTTTAVVDIVLLYSFINSQSSPVQFTPWHHRQQKLKTATILARKKGQHRHFLLYLKQSIKFSLHWN